MDRLSIVKIFLVFGFLLNTPVSGKSYAIINSTPPLFKDRNYTNFTKPSARTVYGLLGYLAGFKMGQGLHPSVYSSEIRESAHLNLFAKLFNGILQISYVKYPYFPQAPELSPYNPSSLYPNHLQPPIWYPHVFLPQSNNPINQQQIINLHEPFNPDDAPNENYQELNSHNTQEIHNNLDKVGPVEVFDPIKDVRPTSVIESKRKLCKDDKFVCVEAIESDSEENSTNSNDETETSNHFNDPVQNASNTTTVQEATSNSSHSNAVPEATTIRSQDLDQSSTNLPMLTISTTENVPNSTKQNFSKPLGYPNSYYHFYNNASAYEHVSITENPLKSHKNFITYENYEDPDIIEHYPPSIVNFPFSQTSTTGNSFHPMGGSYYDNGHGYTNFNEEKFNKKQEDSEFIPLDKSN